MFWPVCWGNCAYRAMLGDGRQLVDREQAFDVFCVRVCGLNLHPELDEHGLQCGEVVASDHHADVQAFEHHAGPTGRDERTVAPASTYC